MSKILWTQKQDIGPAARVQHALAFDSTAARTLLFGGDSLSGTVFGDTWAWDGENWTQVADIGPEARAGHALAYDSIRNRTVLFGGAVGGTGVRDTWEWGDDAWTQIEDTGPAPRSGHAMAFDSIRGRVVLFGGGGVDGNVLGDTWEWDGIEWVQQQDTGPSPRLGHAMAFDNARGRTVLFGGLGNPGPVTLGDTWEYDGTAGNWTQVADIGPDACYGASLVFKNGRCGLFGGASAPAGAAPPPVVYGLTWEWDGALWTARQDIGPGPRVGHALAFDASRNRAVLFGGAVLPLDDPGAANAVRRDTWEQFELGPPSGPGPTGPQVNLDSFTINPDVAVPGDTVSLDVTLIGPAAPSGQVVPVTDPASNAYFDISVPGGAIAGQLLLPLDPALETMIPLPEVFTFVATAGTIAIQRDLLINPNP